MTKIAINIVLLPAEKMAREIIEINKELLKINENKIILGKIVNQPHISLCMGGINTIDLPQIIESIDEISNNFIQLNFQGKLSIQSVSDHEKILWLKINKDDKIQKMHETVMKSVWRYLNYNIENYMLADSEKVEEKTISWIKKYSNFYETPSLFSPHITIGIGNTFKSKRTFNFSSSKIAIFKLGNYCTCKELIYKTSLKLS